MSDYRFRATMVKSENVNISLVGTNAAIDCLKDFIRGMGDIPAHDVKDILLCMKERKIFGYFTCIEDGYEVFCKDANNQLEKAGLLIDEDSWYMASFYSNPEKGREWLELSDEEYELILSEPCPWDKVFEECGAYDLDEHYYDNLLMETDKLLTSGTVKDAQRIMDGMTDFQVKLLEVKMMETLRLNGIDPEQFMKEHPDVKAQGDELKKIEGKKDLNYSFTWKMM